MEVCDHDFFHLADGIAVPHGLYDLNLNVGYITVGISHDTSEFSCDCIKHWWEQYGQFNYPNACSILLLCDSGGSNNARHYIFKEHLQKLVDQIGIEIRISHFPPYCSKYNPIEHRFFSHVSRACQGLIFKDINMIKEFMERTSTKTGLQAFVTVSAAIYHPGQKVSENFNKNMKIRFDDYLPNLNYTAVPSTMTISPFYFLASIRDNIYKTKTSFDRTMNILQQDFIGFE